MKKEDEEMYKKIADHLEISDGLNDKERWHRKIMLIWTPISIGIFLAVIFYLIPLVIGPKPIVWLAEFLVGPPIFAAILLYILLWRPFKKIVEPCMQKYNDSLENLRAEYSDEELKVTMEKFK